jgi:hypothetical protein
MMQDTRVGRFALTAAVTAGSAIQVSDVVKVYP